MTIHRFAIFAVLGVSLGATSDAVAQVAAGGPVLAKTVVDAAIAQAKKDKKTVFVVFHASWCGWCKRMDKFMNDPKLKPIFDKNFTYAHLDVLEDEQHKMLENPGGVELMEKWGGKEAGLPFFLILNTEGKMIVNSMRPSNYPPKTGNTRQPDPRPMAGKPSNTGHPMAPEEVAWFMEMMYQGAKHMTDKDLEQIESWLKSQKKDG